MGTPSPCPWDLSLSGKHRVALTGRRTAPSCPHLKRRSGRVPALPYPPFRLAQYHPSDAGLQEMFAETRESGL
jgi:hypothetical protein